MLALKELLQECGIGETSDETNSAGLDAAAACTSSASTASEAGLESLPHLSQHRALIFFQWRASIDMVAAYLGMQLAASISADC